MENIDILEKLKIYFSIEDVKHYSDWYFDELQKERMFEFGLALDDFLIEAGYEFDDEKGVFYDKINNKFTEYRDSWAVLFSDGLVDDFLNFILDHGRMYGRIINEACKI